MTNESVCVCVCVCVCVFKFWPCFMNPFGSYERFCYRPLPLPRPLLANWYNCGCQRVGNFCGATDRQKERQTDRQTDRDRHTELLVPVENSVPIITTVIWSGTHGFIFTTTLLFDFYIWNLSVAQSGSAAKRVIFLWGFVPASFLRFKRQLTIVAREWIMWLVCNSEAGEHPAALIKR